MRPGGPGEADANPASFALRDPVRPLLGDHNHGQARGSEPRANTSQTDLDASLPARSDTVRGASPSADATFARDEPQR